MNLSQTVESAEWPDEGLESVLSCPACGCGSASVLYQHLVDRVFRCAPGTWTLKKCLGCGSGYLDPRPTIETIHQAYDNYYTHGYPPEPGSGPAGRVHGLPRPLAHGYWNSRFGLKLEPASRMGALIGRLLPPLRRRLDGDFSRLPALGSGARVLDVGFGAGALLERARGLGWSAAGADPDEVVVANAQKQGFEVRQGGIEAFADQSESFDLITLCHVLEHVHSPKSTLRCALELLVPGGQLYLDTPNIEALGHQVFRESWRGLEVPRHLTIFNWDALEGTLMDVGFETSARLVRRDVYLDLARKSRAIRDGKDPYTGAVRSLRDVPGAMLARLRTRINHRNSEFVTLIARKSG